MKRILLFILIISYGFAYSDTIPVTIYGTHKDYAGQIIEVYKTADYITHTKKVIAVDTVDKQGNFKLQYKTAETLLISMPLGIYNAVLFTAPGKSYNVVLPPFQPKTKVDIITPFFKPVEIYLGIKDSDSTDLNFQIADFNDKYYNFIDSNYYYIFKHSEKKFIDSVITLFEKKFVSDTVIFFKNYRIYKYAWLKFVSYMRDDRYVIREYFNDKPVLYQNPAYMDLFNQLFANYLTIYSNKPEGERLYSDVAFAKSPKYIYETFENNMVLLNDTLQEFVLLKGLYDEFYQKNYNISSLLITLDSVKTLTTVDEHKMIADNIRKKVLKTRSGFPAAKFELRDANGIFRSSNDYLANYVYLNFMSVESFSCQQDLELLKKLYEKHKTDFKIISISIDDDFEKAVDYFKQNGYNWTLLSYKEQKNIIDEYNVKAYPTYYLIDPDGKFAMSPAASPGENFEWYFFKMLQAKKRRQLREENK